MESTSNPHRILVVDDHSVVRHGLTMLLQKEPDLQVCGEAGTFDEALAAAQALQPEIALVDITLKDRNGLDLIREWRKNLPGLRGLVLSMHDEAEYADRALRSGARGYVMKEDADEVIVTAIRKVLSGEVYVSPAMSTRLINQISHDAGNKDAETSAVASLTGRELEIFSCVGEGLSSRQIADKYQLSERTVEVHRANIKKKLGCENAAQVLREAVRWVESQKS